MLNQTVRLGYFYFEGADQSVFCCKLPDPKPKIRRKMQDVKELNRITQNLDK